MIIDKQARFDWDDAITATRVSTDKIDLQANNRDLGLLESLYLVIIATEAFTAAGAATLTVDLVDDDNASLSSPATLLTLANAVGKATLVAGYTIFKGRLPIEKVVGGVYPAAAIWTVRTVAGAVNCSVRTAPNELRRMVYQAEPSVRNMPAALPRPSG